MQNKIQIKLVEEMKTGGLSGDWKYKTFNVFYPADANWGEKAEIIKTEIIKQQPLLVIETYIVSETFVLVRTAERFIATDKPFIRKHFGDFDFIKAINVIGDPELEKKKLEILLLHDFRNNTEKRWALKYVPKPIEHKVVENYLQGI